MMPVIYGNSYQILQTPGYVAIRYEMVQSKDGASRANGHEAPRPRSDRANRRRITISYLVSCFRRR